MHYLCIINNNNINTMKQVNVEGLRDIYSIDIKGNVYSKWRNKTLKPAINNVGYKQYYLSKSKGCGKWYKIHYLIMITYGTQPPTDKHEINHIDHDKTNNNIDNLEWVTHKENINKARLFKPWKSGREPGFKASEETKQKMSKAKLKPVNVYDTNNALILKGNSIQHVADTLDIYRVAVYRSLQNGKQYKGYRFEFD